MTIDRIAGGLGYAALTHSVRADDSEPKRVCRETAILLIDMQDYFMEQIAKKVLQPLISHQIEVLDYCKEYNLPVFVLEYSGHGKTTKKLAEKVNLLKRKKFLKKRCTNGFQNTELATQLHNIKRIILMGIEASVCVLSTAEGAINNGFTIMTSRQLIVDPEVKKEYFEDTINWYKSNGIYQDDYIDLLKLISR